MKTYITIIISILFISTCFAQQDLLPAFPRELSYDGDVAYYNGSPFTGLLVDEKTKKRLGEFRNGYKNGMFLENYANGKKKSEGKYANGIPIDTHNFWSENGLTLNEKKYLNGIVIKEVIYENGQIIKTKDLLTEFYPNGQKKSEGFLISGNKEGFWTFWYEGGLKKSEGNYKEGNQSGQWVLWFEDGGKKFEGNYLNGKKDGQGIERSKSGVTYNGSWKNDSREGYGTITLADGSMFYQGEFIDGEMNGQGIAYDHGKKIYEGEWKNGKRNGKGTYYEEDKEGSSQGTGNFVNNRFEGHGTFTKKFFSGAVASFIGEFKNGNFYDGIFYVTYTDGDKIAVEYKNGIKGNAIKIK